MTEMPAPANNAEGIDIPNKAAGIVVAPVEKNDIFIRLLTNVFIPAPFRDIPAKIDLHIYH